MSNRAERFVAISADGVVDVHAIDTTGNYATFCGLDGHDSHAAVNQAAAEMPDNPRITCAQCYQLFVHARRYRMDDFSAVLRSAPSEPEKGK